jgi:hypothetical protein
MEYFPVLQMLWLLQLHKLFKTFSLHLSVFFFFYGTGTWTQCFVLAKQALYHLSWTSSPFCYGYFGDGLSQTICLSWPHTMILRISASQVTRIIGMSHCLNSHLPFSHFLVKQ